MFETIDIDSNDFGLECAGDRQDKHFRHAGIRQRYVPADHRLGENAAAVEIDRFDDEAVLLPDFFQIHDAAQIGADARAAVAENK